MKVRINWVCKAKSKNASYEAENIFIDKELEWLPQIGAHIQVHRDGLLGKVEDIFIDLFQHEDGSPSVRIYLEEPDRDPDLRPWLEMKRQGWKIGD
jgi:hypothetical protein